MPKACPLHLLAAKIKQTISIKLSYVCIRTSEVYRTGGGIIEKIYELHSAALQVLRSCGVRVAAGNPTELTLVLPDGRSRTVVVTVRRSPPPPSTVDHIRHRSRGTQALIITHHMTQYLRDCALGGLVDVIAVDNEIAIIAGITFTPPALPSSAATTPARRGPKPWTRWAVERLLLLTDEPKPQAHLAEELAVSQQSISHVLRRHPLASREGGGWVIVRKDDLLDQYLLEYPGAGGPSTYWFGLEQTVQQVVKARTLTTELAVSVLTSGDVAADTYAPWRLPAYAAIYTAEILDFTPAGFTPARPGEHTLQVTVPDDPTVWRTAAAMFPARHGQGLADPIITLTDLRRSPGPDATEASEHLRQAIMSGEWRV